MPVISLLAGIFMLGFGLLFTWPICIIWATLAAGKHNKKRWRKYLQKGAMFA